METLRADMRANIGSLSSFGPTSTVGELAAHLRNTLWPMLEAMVDEVEEIDDVVAGIVSNSEDILQPDTSAMLVAVISGAMVLVTQQLEKRVNKDAEGKVWAAIKEWRQLAAKSLELLSEITLPEDDGDGEDVADNDDEAESADATDAAPDMGPEVTP
jgi:hypothetical protein